MVTVVFIPVLTFALGVLVTILVMQRIRAAEAVSEDGSHGGAQALELVLRATGAGFGCLVGGEGELIRGAASGLVRNQALAVARLAMHDERAHRIELETDVILAAGDGQRGAAVVIGRDALGEEAPGRIYNMLRMLAESSEAVGTQIPAGSSDVLTPGSWAAAGPESLEIVANRLADLAVQIVRHQTAVVVIDRTTRRASIVAVSKRADRRLLGLLVQPDSAVGRACHEGTPMAAATLKELTGLDSPDRRRGFPAATVFPLVSGAETVGALIVFAPRKSLSELRLRELSTLLNEATPQLGAAIAIRAAETRALTDHLTGLPNRRALERVMSLPGVERASLICIDIDHFKQVNDTYGHPAGDAVLKQIARILRASLRDRDVAARTGGEEFSLWLPDTDLTDALEVAERVRKKVESTIMDWQGKSLRVTCSGGIATFPDAVGDIRNLYPAADRALYRAKERGRNRVEVSAPSH